MTAAPEHQTHMNLIEEHMVSAYCDTCGENYSGEWPRPLYDNIAIATTELTKDGWTITPTRFQCTGCTEDHEPHHGRTTTPNQRWRPYHGWSVSCQDCGTSHVELDDDHGRFVWETREEALTTLQDHSDWTHTGRTRCPQCTDKHTCHASGHQWKIIRRRMDINIGVRVCERCNSDELIALATP